MEAWLSICLVIPCFLLPWDVFSSMLWTPMLRTKLNFLQLLAFGLTHICGQPIDPMEIHLLHWSPWWGKNYIPWCYTKCFCVHCKRCKVSCFMGANPCSFVAFFSIFSLVGQHCFVGWWHSHIGWCHHCWSHLSKLGNVGSSFSWGGCKSDGSCEGRTLLQPLPNGCVFFFWHRGFWVSSPAVWQLSSLMC